MPLLIEINRFDTHVEIALNRPESRNALNRALVGELHEALGDLESDPAVLVIYGKGGHFCGGADLSEMVARRRDDALEGINLRLFERLRNLPMPSIAAIDGFALGGGAELAYAADLRVATTRAVVGNPEAALGILAAAGGAYRLRDLVGESTARLMLYCGRRLVGVELATSGLAVAVVEPEDLLDSARALVAEMAMATPTALRITKLALDAPAGAHPVLDLVAQAVLFEDHEKVVRMQAFLDGRAGRRE